MMHENRREIGMRCLPAIAKDAGENRSRKGVAIGLRQPAHGQPNLCRYGTGLIEQEDATVSPIGWAKGSRHRSIALLPRSEELPQRAHRARLIDATNHYQRGIVGIKKTFASEQE